MREFLGRAWSGWLEYMGAGKLTAVFFLVLLLLLMLKVEKGRHSALVKYALFMAAVCVCPVTAGILMKYQTAFYDYQWIWTLVPVTAATACGGTLLLDRLLCSGTLSGRQKGMLAGTALLLLLLCGAFGNTNTKWNPRDLRQEREKAALVLEQIGDGGEVCLWAPEEIMAHARELDGSLTLAYGRNMWQEALNAYSYDTYTMEQREMYVWMVMAGRTGRMDEEIGKYLRVVGEIPPEGTVLKGEEIMRSALELGVNRILLPGCMEEDALAELETFLGAPAEKLEDYYLFRLRGGVY